MLQNRQLLPVYFPPEAPKRVELGAAYCMTAWCFWRRRGDKLTDGPDPAHLSELGLVDLVGFVEDDPDHFLVVLQPHQNLGHGSEEQMLGEDVDQLTRGAQEPAKKSKKKN